MDPVEWERVQSIFHDALERHADERDAFVAGATHDDPRTGALVRRMLTADRVGDSPLDRSLARFAADLLDGGGPHRSHAGPFGPWHVTGALGEGGSGVVLRARHHSLGHHAAVKVLRDAALSPARSERFLREQRLLAQLHHPGIAQLHEAGILDDGTPWFAMECIEGTSLTEHVRAVGASLHARLALLESVCDAVEYVHRQAILHRDLKPANIVVDADGRPRLLDFGIGKELPNEAESQSGNTTAVRMMTPAYASPEQLRGEPLGVDVDVYALGVMLYELLTDVHPFPSQGRSSGEVERAVLEATVPRPSTQSAPGVTASRTEWSDLDLICQTAMQRDRTRRYPTVAALHDDLVRFRTNRPLWARPESFGYRATTFVRRHRSRLLITTAGALAIVALLARHGVELGAARDAAQAEALRARRAQQFTAGLFAGGDDAVGPAESLRVITLLDQGELDAAGLGTDPVMQADLLGTLGEINHKIGRLGRADTLLRRAVAIRGQLGRAEESRTIEATLRLAQLQIDLSNLAEADSLARGALQQATQIRPPSDQLVGMAWHTIGLVRQNQGSYDSSIVAFSRAASLIERDSTAVRDLIASLNELSNSHFYRGDYDASDSLNLRVLALTRATYGVSHPLVAEDLMNLGAVRQERGDLDSAAALMQQATVLIEGWYGPDHFRTAGALVMLSRVLQQQGKVDTAAALVERSLAIQRRTFGDSNWRVASAMSNVADLAAARGNLDSARRTYLRARDIYAAANGPTYRAVGLMTLNAATMEFRLGKHVAAERLAREALRVYAASLPPDHDFISIGHYKLGRMLLGQGRNREGEAELRIALAAFETSGNYPAFLKATQDALRDHYLATGRRAEAEALAAADTPARP